MDFSRISRSRTGNRPIDPIELFHSLSINDPNINDLWLGQGDALRTWHCHRDKNDVAIVLNTGAGKTLIGLLAAQSLVNETRGQVVYACASIQLVHQTASKAHGYGMQVTTYINSEFNNDLYQRAEAPCVTTYHALLNGRSRFFRDEISAIVFDDAHTAEHLIRDAFSLRIMRSELPGLYTRIFRLFRSYHDRIGFGVGYTETYQNQDVNSLWFVPPFVLRENAAELQRLLIEANLSDITSTKFAWSYLRDRIDLCACIVNGQEILFTPPLPPVDSLPYFSNNVRRLYLSATLSAKDGFMRTFGRVPNEIIAPTTNAGECERLILIPSLNQDCGDDKIVAKEIIADRKSLILVPTHRQSRYWEDVLTHQSDTDVADLVDQFKSCPPPAALLLVSRYDGVDLPGDTCRVLIIDELPSGLGLLERYMWERLGVISILRSTIASRIVQSFGRISRGMSDHGVVVITGKHIVDWLLKPNNRAVLPPFLRQQIELGIDISRQASSVRDLIDAAGQCLDRDKQWIEYYQENMRDVSRADSASGNGEDDALFLASAEVNFIKSFWDRDFVKAAQALQSTIDRTFDISLSVGAWHALWLGYCYELLGEHEAAREYYQRAHGAAKNIPAFVESVDERRTNDRQVLEVAAYLNGGSRIRDEMIHRCTTQLSALTTFETSGQIEEALRALGEFLGLDSTRPEKEFGTGPDVLWVLGTEMALCMEAKTGKKREGEGCYTKRDLGQLRDHVQWVKDHYTVATIIPVFVGPVLPASERANPDNDTVIVTPEAFYALGERVLAALKDISSSTTIANLEEKVNLVFAERRLLGADMVESLSPVRLINVSPE